METLLSVLLIQSVREERIPTQNGNIVLSVLLSDRHCHHPCREQGNADSVSEGRGRPIQNGNTAHTQYTSLPQTLQQCLQRRGRLSASKPQGHPCSRRKREVGSVHDYDMDGSMTHGNLSRAAEKERNMPSRNCK